MKKIISIILCLTMFFTFASVSAFAADGKIDIVISAKWVNEKDEEKRPDEIVAHFYVYGLSGMGMRLSTTNDWTYTIKNVKATEDDYNKYDMRSDKIDGYDQTISKKLENDVLYLTTIYTYINEEEPENPGEGENPEEKPGDDGTAEEKPVVKPDEKPNDDDEEVFLVNSHKHEWNTLAGSGEYNERVCTECGIVIKDYMEKADEEGNPNTGAPAFVGSTIFVLAGVCFAINKKK